VGGTLVKVVLGVLIGFGLGAWFVGTRDAEAPAVPASAAGTPAAETPAGTAAPGPQESLWREPDEARVGERRHSRFAELARQVAPGVVNVHTSKTVRSMPFGGFPFHEFFGGPAPRGGREFRIPSLGSGFIISPDGLIVTNNHVVDGVDEIRVALHDGRELPAKIVGQDPKTDIALIRAEGAQGLHALPLGDSDALLPGDWVLAIGNPFGLEHTVTVGIVSAKGRDIGQGPYDDFIQTDAAINPGNSGGPLIDVTGAVVGINTAINPQANTIGFAVPVSMAKDILPQLEAAGRVTRGWLGVVVQPVTPALAEAFGLEEEEGALVSQVVPGSPAAAAQLRRGDVIVRFGDRPIDEMRELPRAVSLTPPGEKVGVEIVRNGTRKTVEVTVAKLAEPERVARRGAPPGGVEGLGLRVQDLTPALRERLGVQEPGGVVIAEVDPDGAAAAVGLRAGDVLLEVGRQPIRDVSDLQRKLAASGRRVLLLVRRGESLFFAAVTLRS
jgi:serine protease Do